MTVLLICATAVVLVREPGLRAASEFTSWVAARDERNRSLAKCLTCRLPGTYIVFDESPLRPASDPSDVPTPGSWTVPVIHPSDTPAVRTQRWAAVSGAVPKYFPACLCSFTSADDRLASPPHTKCYSSLRQILPNSGFLTGTPLSSVGSSVAFMHSRCTPAGRERLVVVTFDGRAFAWADAPPITVSTYRTSGLMGSWRIWTRRMVDLPLHRRAQPLRLYAGQADPNDASHFTIAFVFAGQPEAHIDGWLLNDDHVKLCPSE